MQKPQWTIGGGINAGVFGRVYPVVLDTALDPHDVFRIKRLPGVHETMLCSNPETAQWIAQALNHRAATLSIDEE